MASIRSIRERGQLALRRGRAFDWALKRLGSGLRSATLEAFSMQIPERVRGLIDGCGAQTAVGAVSMLTPDGWKVLGITTGPLALGGAPAAA
ncbi:hypothetical protein [Acidovorax sp. NCPPB 3576]|uniref:hypothetical protein n=1 Tax=Acidovorax sp. NCPPB 3576 TaxID=2940488 RepID=UPI00234BFD62|nr:hypothetical protein [Acidovorax sp. NCPPB 3576]WCM88836.1 hypothetical protein M5C98_01925 [Acidovorax sp. NCPPB 3576]